MAELTYVHSAMGQGKTLELMRQAYTLSEHGRWGVMVGKPGEDDKAGANVESRFGDGNATTQRAIDIIFAPDDNVCELTLRHFEARSKHPVRLAAIFDESQFFSPAQIDQMRELVDDHDVDVWAYGLRTDFQAHTFPASHRLFEIADNVIDINSLMPELAICPGHAGEACENKAIFNTRLIDGAFVFEGAQKAIDQENAPARKAAEVTTYRALCSPCYNSAKLESQRTASKKRL